MPCVHVKLLCLFQVVVGSWLDLFRSVYCDQVAPSGGECRPRGVYRGLRSPAALASPVLSVDPAVFDSLQAQPAAGVSVDPAVNSAAGAPPVGVSVVTSGHSGLNVNVMK